MNVNMLKQEESLKMGVALAGFINSVFCLE